MLLHHHDKCVKDKKHSMGPRPFAKQGPSDYKTNVHRFPYLLLWSAANSRKYRIHSYQEDPKVSERGMEGDEVAMIL